MFSFHSSLGIDFRSDHINVAHLVRTFKGLTLADSAILEPFYEPESTLQERYKLLFEDLRRFLRDKRITPDSVVLGLPRKDLMLKFINIPRVPKDEIGKVVEYELDRMFPNPAEELFYDYKILKEDESSGLKVLIIAIPKKNLDLLFENLQELGLKLSAINVSTISLFNLYNFNKKMSDGSEGIFLNFENGCSEITASINGEILLTRYLNLKGENNQEENSGLLVKQIGQIEDQIKSENDGIGPGKIILSGKLECYQDLLEDIGKKANLEFEGFDPFVKIKKDIIENPNGKLTTAISLALQGLSNVKYDMNILPGALRVKKRNYGPVVMIVLLTIILILVSGTMLRLSFRERIALKEIQAKSKNIISEADAVKGIRKKVQDYISYIEAFNEIRDSDVSKLLILKELSKIIPNQEEDLVWLTRMEINGDELQINGYAEASEGLLSIFESSPFFSTPRFEGTTTKGRDEKERFTLTAKILSVDKNVIENMQKYDEALADPAKFMEMKKKAESEEKTPEKSKAGNSSPEKSKKKKSTIGDMLKKPVTGY